MIKLFIVNVYQYSVDCLKEDLIINKTILSFTFCLSCLWDLHECNILSGPLKASSVMYRYALCLYNAYTCYITSASCRRHHAECHSTKLHQCRQCDYSNKRLSRVQAHVKAKHLKVHVYVRPVCLCNLCW